MTEVERNLSDLLCEQDYFLVDRVRVARFIKHIWVASRHVRNDDVGSVDLSIDLSEDGSCEVPLVNSLALGTYVVTSLPDTPVIHSPERLAERHQYEHKW